MSQEKRILSRLKRGPLTPLQALQWYGCLRLAARVHNLRGRGHDIGMRWVERDDKRFAQYYLQSLDTKKPSELGNLASGKGNR